MQRLKARDAEIDAGIDSISRGIDNLVNISSAMKDEVNFYVHSHLCFNGILTIIAKFYLLFR